MFDVQYVFFSFTQLNKRRIFLLRHLVGLFSFHIRENVYKLCFLFCLFCFKEDSYFIFLFSFKSYKQDFLGFGVIFDVYFLFSLTKMQNKNVDLQPFINDLGMFAC